MDLDQHSDTSDGSMLYATALDVEDVSLPPGNNWFDGQLLGFDLETTSLDTRVSLPVQYAFVLKQAGVPLRYHSKSAIVDPGVDVPEDVVKIHGITTDRCRSEGTPLLETIKHIVDRFLWASGIGIPLVGFNISYDLTIIDRLAREYLGSGLVAMGWDGPVLDVFVLDKQLDKYRSGSRKLSSTAKHYNVALEVAHDAAADVMATLGVLMVMIQRFTELQRPPAGWWKDQVQWRREQSESFSVYRVRNGQPPIASHEHHWPIYKFEAIDSDDCTTE